MLHLEGEETFDQPLLDLWNRLTDLSSLSRCIPDLVSIKRAEPDLLICVVRPGFSFLRGTLELTLENMEKQPPRSALMRIHAKGIGSSASGETRMELSPSTSGSGRAQTQLHWTAVVQELGGLLRPLSSSLMESVARKVIADAWSAFRRDLGGSP